MKLSNRLAAGAAVSALSAFYGGAASAQDITTAIRGVVTGPDGAPLAGESVIVTDTRTGVRRSVTTNSAGGFTVGGLESGGPFTIRVDSEDYQDELITDVFTSLGRTANFNISLGSLSAGGAEEIVVTASASSFTQLAIGPSATFGLETLQNVPSISRGIRDTIRLDPRVSIDRSDGGNGTGISCLGGNNRFNAFTIDGVRNEDAFGLNSSGFPSRNTLPIPFDAIRETSVEFSPYSVEYGQSTGCQINIVTKGGTNEFHGSAFGVFNSDGLTGSKLEGDNLGGDPFNDWNWGAEIGGPIIKDKLFFYAAYEEVQDGGDQQEDGPEDGNFANSILGLTTAEANQIASIIEDTYGFETGGIATILPESSRRILGRVDWNITDNHRAAFTYSRLRESNIEPD
ncbi:MAG: TonB-dependent receptor, partial [Pseudomonadota bacterium]